MKMTVGEVSLLIAACDLMLQKASVAPSITADQAVGTAMVRKRLIRCRASLVAFEYQVSLNPRMSRKDHGLERLGCDTWDRWSSM